MPSRIDGPKETQNPLHNKPPERIGKKKLWQGRSVQQKTAQQKANSPSIDLPPEQKQPTPRLLDKKKIFQVDKDQGRKRRRGLESTSSSNEEDPEGTQSPAEKVNLANREVFSPLKRARSEEILKTEKKQKLEPKKESFLDSQIAGLEAKYEKKLQYLPALSKRIYFEAANQDIFATSPSGERENFEEDLSGSRPGIQLFITEKKITEYVDQQPKDVQKIFQPILETIQRSKKIFLGIDVLRRNKDPQTAIQIKEELAHSMEEAVKNTPIGHSTLIPAGYSMKREGGHATPLVLTRISDTKYRLQIYNTGDGLDLHEHTDTIPIKIYPLVYQEVDINKLSKDFFSEIIHVYNLKANELSKTILPVMLHTTIVNALDIGIDPVASKKEKPYCDQGPIGRCTYSPLSRYVHNQLKNHEEVYARYKLYTTTSLVTQYTKKLNEEISSGSIGEIDILSRDLFEKLQAIGEATLKDRKEKIEWIKDSKRSDKQFMLEQVKKNGRFLRFGTDDIKKDIDVALAAIRNDPKAIYYVHPDLKKDIRFAKEIVQSYNSRAEEFLLDFNNEVISNFNKDAEFIKFAANIDVNFLMFADSELKDDRDFIFSIIKMGRFQPITVANFASSGMKNDPVFWAKVLASSNVSKEKFAEMVLLEAPEYIDLIPTIKPFLNNEMFMKKLVQEKGSVIQYASDELRNNRAVAEAAVRNAIDAFQYLSSNLREDASFMRFVLENDPHLILIMSHSLFKDSKFLREIIQKLGPEDTFSPGMQQMLIKLIGIHADENIKKDPSFWKQIRLSLHLSDDDFAEVAYSNACPYISFAIDPAILSKKSDDRNFVLEAVKSNQLGVAGIADILKQVSTRLKKDKQFWMELYGNTSEQPASKYVASVFEAILLSNDPECLSHGLDPSLLDTKDPEVIEYVERECPLTHEYLSHQKNKWAKCVVM